MAQVEDFDDDYVARLLAEDARKTSQKYSSQGLSAFLPKRKNVDAPKPNTRFLSHIVREADNHNAALKRKEETEAKRRLREMQATDERPRKRSRIDETVNSKRSRLSRDIMAAAQSEKPRRHQETQSSQRNHNHNHNRRDSVSPDRRHSRRHKHDSHARDRRDVQSSKRIRDTSTDSVQSGLDQKHRRRRISKERRLRGENTDKFADSAIERPKSGQYKRDGGEDFTETEDPVRKRGRGSHKSASGIDDRFARNYDPSQDISYNSEQDEEAEDWDMALEAMRDRAKWRQNQTARLREAGFEEKDILKWEKGVLNADAAERNPDDVKWTRKGETREWDAGKVQQ